MGFEDFQSVNDNIDIRQDEIDALDGETDDSLELAGNLVTTVFDRTVDEFQDFVADLNIPEGEKLGFLKGVLNVLVEVAEEDMADSNVVERIVSAGRRLKDLIVGFKEDVGGRFGGRGVDTVDSSRDSSRERSRRYDENVEVAANLDEKVDALLDYNERFTEALVGVEIIDVYLQQIVQENKLLGKEIKEMRENLEGWGGFTEAIEPSDYITNFNATFRSGEGYTADTGEMRSLEARMDYLSGRQDIETSLHLLGRVIRGSMDKGSPIDMGQAWNYIMEHRGEDPQHLYTGGLSRAAYQEFKKFADSADGMFFKKTFISGEVTPENMDSALADYRLNKAREIDSNLGIKAAAPFYKFVANEYPGTKASAEAMQVLKVTRAERFLRGVMEFTDEWFSLDSITINLALAAVGPAASALSRGTAVGARVAGYGARIAAGVSRYPRAAAAARMAMPIGGFMSESTGSLGIRILKFFGNWGINIVKKEAYVYMAESAGGEDAATVVGAICTYMPGFTSGYKGASSRGGVGNSAFRKGAEKYANQRLKSKGRSVVYNEVRDEVENYEPEEDWMDEGYGNDDDDDHDGHDNPTHDIHDYHDVAAMDEFIGDAMAEVGGPEVFVAMVMEGVRRDAEYTGEDVPFDEIEASLRAGIG